MTFWDEQMAHEPTKLYYEKLKEVIQENNRRVRGVIPLPHPIIDIELDILEIGLDVGISARCFLEFPNITLTSVDPGEVDIGQREIGELKVGNRWTFHHMTSDKFFSECKKEFDIIYIDGDHSYEQTKKDVNNAWKFVKDGGIIIGHDFLHKGNFYTNKDYGVTRAFCEFIKEQNVEAHIYPPNPGLIVIKK